MESNIVIQSFIIFNVIQSFIIFNILEKMILSQFQLEEKKIVDQFLGVSTYLEVVLDEGVNVKCSFSLRRPFCPSFSVSPFFTF